MNQRWTSGIIWFGYTGDLLACSYWWIFEPIEECHMAILEAATWHLPKVRLAVFTVEKNMLAEVEVEPMTYCTQTIFLTTYATG